MHTPPTTRTIAATILPTAGIGTTGGRRTIDYHAVTIADCTVGAQTVLQNAYSQGTLYEATKQLRKLQELQAATGISDPVEAILMFAGYELSRGTGITTIKGYVGALKIALKLMGHNLDDLRLSLMEKGLARLKSRDGEEARAQPATLANMERIATELGPTHPVEAGIMLIAWCTASRIGDVERLKPESISFTGMQEDCHVMEVKWLERKDLGTSGTVQVVLAKPDWKTIMDKMVQVATTRRSGRPSPTDPCLLGEFGDVSTVMKERLRPLTKHSFRRGAAQAIARLTGDPLSIQAMTGHKTIECLRRYIPDLYRAINLRAAVALVNDAPQAAAPIDPQQIEIGTSSQRPTREWTATQNHHSRHLLTPSRRTTPRTR